MPPMDANDTQTNNQQEDAVNQNKKSVHDYNLMAIGEAIYDLKLEQAVLGDGNASHRQNNDGLRTGFASMFTLLAHKEENNPEDFKKQTLTNLDPEIKVVAESLFNHKDNESTKRIVNTFEKTLKASVLDKQLWETAIPENNARKQKLEQDRAKHERAYAIANGNAGGILIGVVQAEPQVYEVNNRIEHHYTREVHTPETTPMRRRSYVQIGLLAATLCGVMFNGFKGCDNGKKLDTVVNQNDTTHNKIDSTATMVHFSDSTQKAQAEFNHNDMTKQIDTVQTKQQQTLNSVARMRRVVNTMSKNIDSVKANTAPVVDTTAFAPTFN